MNGTVFPTWQKGSRLRRQCSTGYGNAPATRRVEFSAQQNNGARKQRNSIKMLVLDARLVTLTQKSNGNLSAAPDLHVIMSFRGLVGLQCSEIEADTSKQVFTGLWLDHKTRILSLEAYLGRLRIGSEFAGRHRYLTCLGQKGFPSLLRPDLHRPGQRRPGLVVCAVCVCV